VTTSRQAHGVVRNDGWTVLPELRRKFDTHLSVALGGIQRGDFRRSRLVFDV
jgi:hypothetical protein